MGLATTFSLSYLAWFSLVPLWWSLVHNNCQKEGPPLWTSAALKGALWGLGYYGLSLYWIVGIHPLTWMGIGWWPSLAIALGCWLAITLGGMIFVISWSCGLIWCHRQPLRLWWGVTLWCSLETLWSSGILWWNGLALTQSPSQLPLLQWVQGSGEITLTAAIVVVNGLWAEALLRQGRSPLRRWGMWLLPLLLIAGLYWGGNWLYSRPLADDLKTGIKVGIIQGNIPNEIKLNPQGYRQAIAGYTQGYQSLVQQGVDGVLTPEGALPYFWEDIVQDSPFYRAVLQYQVPVWLGAYGRQGNDYTNSLFAIGSTGTLEARYDKVKRVPLGEYIPFSRWLSPFIRRLSPLTGELGAGDSQQTFSTPFGPAVVSICYESAFGSYLRQQLQRGGRFILSSANNAHYSVTMPRQHHALDVLRAIEGDRWLARATNTGYSAFISPRGETLWLSALNQYQIHSAWLYPRQTQTLYHRWGNWLVPVLWVITLLTRVICKSN